MQDARRANAAGLDLRNALLLIPLALCGCFLPPGARPSLEVGALGATQYNRRGMIENEHGVVQAEAKTRMPLALGGAVELKAWGNMDLTRDTGDAWFPDGHAGEVTEVDLSGSYGRRVGPLDLSAGVVGYIHPYGSEFLNGSRGNTIELFVAAGGEVLSATPFDFYPLVVASYDPDAVDGFYVNGGLFKGWEVMTDLRLRLGAALGFSDKHHSQWTYGFQETGWADLRGTLSLEYSLGRNTTIAAAVAASTLLDGEIQDWVEERAIVARRAGGVVERGIDSDTVWATLGLSWRL